MEFASYTAFRNACLAMIDGDDASGSIKNSTLDLLIGLGENRVYRDLRCSSMEAELSATVTGNAIALPEDCLALSIVWFDPAKPIEVVSEADLRSRSRYSGGGDVRRCAQAGDTLIFSPEASDGDVLAGRYYQKPAALATGALPGSFTRYPEVYLFATLAESAPFIGEDSRIPMWKQLYAEWLDSANRMERARAFDGSRLVAKSR